MSDVKKPDNEFGIPGETPEQELNRLRAENKALRDEAERKALAAENEALRKAAEPAEDKQTLDSQGFPKEYVVLEIFPGREKHDLSYVPLAIGGFAMKVQRGVEVIVPKVFVTECLEHAVEEVTTRSEGGLETRPALRFPYQVKRTATEAEYKAQQAKAAQVSGAGVRP